MFFERNKKLLIGSGVAAILWIVLYFVFVSPLKEDAKNKQEQAANNRKTWEDFTDNAKEQKATKGRGNEWVARATAEKELNESSVQTEEKFKELSQIEFGTHQSLKAFSTAAAGAGGDKSNLLTLKTKETTARAKTILNNNELHDNLFSEHFGDNSSLSLNLLRVAMIARFLSVCKDIKDPSTGECKISDIK